VFRTTKQNLVPEANAPIYLLMNLLTRQKLLFIEPAADASALKSIVQPPRERFVFVAAADEAGKEFDRLIEN
jgi:hypothetical protein